MNSKPGKYSRKTKNRGANPKNPKILGLDIINVMTEILERPPQEEVPSLETEWDHLVSQLSDGGNGNFIDGGGDDNDDGAYGDGLPDEPERRRARYLWVYGTYIGAVAGTAAGLGITKVGQTLGERQYMSYPPASSTQKAVLKAFEHNPAQISTLFGPIIGITALGVIGARRLQNWHNRGHGS